jgi:F-type H+-transporting ATPase subunit delta
MITTRVARRYAQALLESAESERVLEPVLNDARLLQEYVDQSRDLRLFLRSPVIKTEKKASILQTLFEPLVHRLTMNFILLLLEKRREEVLPVIIEQLFVLNDQQKGIVNLELRAATDLSKTHRSAITRRFEQLMGKKIRISFSVDVSLKGGVLARVGDTVYDGSVRRQLEMLKEQFARGVVSN